MVNARFRAHCGSTFFSIADLQFGKTAAMQAIFQHRTSLFHLIDDAHSLPHATPSSIKTVLDRHFYALSDRRKQ